VDRLLDALVGSAATDVARQSLFDLVVARIRVLGQECRRRHDLTGLAIPALGDTLRNPSPLDCVHPVHAQAFDRGDFPVGDP